MNCLLWVTNISLIRLSTVHFTVGLSSPAFNLVVDHSGKRWSLPFIRVQREGGGGGERRGGERGVRGGKREIGHCVWKGWGGGEGEGERERERGHCGGERETEREEMGGGGGGDRSL